MKKHNLIPKSVFEEMFNPKCIEDEWKWLITAILTTRIGPNLREKSYEMIKDIREQPGYADRFKAVLHAETQPDQFGLTVINEEDEQFVLDFVFKDQG